MGTGSVGAHFAAAIRDGTDVPVPPLSPFRPTSSEGPDVNPVADSVAELTPAWLADVLGRPVVSVASERIGTGQIGESHRLSLKYDGEPGPSTLVAKLAASDAAARERVKDGYAKEVGFYTQLAATVDVRTPRCWYGAISDDSTTFTLLLDDLSPSVPGVQTKGCSPAQAAEAVRNLVGLHAPRWDDESLLGVDLLTPTTPDSAIFLGELFDTSTGGFIERYDTELPAVDVATLRDVSAAITKWLLARPRPFAIVHGDYRLDNLMFLAETNRVSALDWQTVSLAPPLRDVAYFLGTSLEPSLRRANEEKVVAAYHEAIMGRGIVDYDGGRCWEDYRLGQLQGPMITVLGCMFATTERSVSADGMFLSMATRSCSAIRELRSLDLL